MLNSCIKSFLEDASRTLGCSLGKYWPVGTDTPDPDQKNVCVHVAHAMLKREFAVFAEADYPHRTAGGVDLLGIAPSCEWFLACEFQQIYVGKGSDSKQSRCMLEDIGRLEAFWLRTDFAPEKYVSAVLGTAEKCKCGYGLVGGLYFDARHDTQSALLTYWQERNHNPDTSIGSLNECAKRLNAKDGAEWLALHVGRFATGDYWLLSAFFPVHRPSEMNGDKRMSTALRASRAADGFP